MLSAIVSFVIQAQLHVALRILYWESIDYQAYFVKKVGCHPNGFYGERNLEGLGTGIEKAMKSNLNC